VVIDLQNVSRTQPTKGIAFKVGPGPCVGYVAGLIGCTWPSTNGQKNVPNGWNGTPQADAEMRAVRDHPCLTFLTETHNDWSTFPTFYAVFQAYSCRSPPFRQVSTGQMLILLSSAGLTVCFVAMAIRTLAWCRRRQNLSRFHLRRFSALLVRTVFFPLLICERSFYQDRLGTSIGKTLNKRTPFDRASLASGLHLGLRSQLLRSW
jgi:hypothetical protein